MRGVSTLVGAAAIAAVICTSASAGVVKGNNGNNGNGGNSDSELVPTGKGWGERPANFQGQNGQGNNAGKKPGGSNGINYHGGPVLLGGPNVYYIWYGNWSGNTAPSILTDLLHGLDGSHYFNINTSYTDGSGSNILNIVHYVDSKNSTTVGYSHGTSLNDAAVQAIVSETLQSGALGAPDPQGVYFVLTSADVNETSGFCTQYCGWHAHATIGAQDIKYSFVGNADRCPSACAWQTTGPNGNAGADAMASIIAHELEEATTDPDLNAWYDVRGQENADKCAWTFGATSTSTNGALYNMALTNTTVTPPVTRNFLIQQNWVNASGGYCAKSYP